MTATPIPSAPWQITGNHWLALPCIHPADGALHALGMLHRGARAAVEFAGDPGFATGTGRPLARPTLSINGTPIAFGDTAMAWERAIGWLPTFTSAIGTLVVRATIFAPYGRDADTAGAVYAFAIENRGDAPANLSIGLEGVLGHRQLRVTTPRPFEDAHEAQIAADDIVTLRGRALPGLAALAIGADGPGEVTTGHDGAGSYRLTRELVAQPGAHAEAAFFIAAGPESDGAVATVSVMRRRGWRTLLTATRDALRALEQSSGNDALDLLINRNLLLAYFYGVGRALDDAHFYLVRTRAPWHSHGVTIREWEALTWTIPAVQLADAPLARELILRACEIHGYAPGSGARYLDGTLFEPGFSLEGAAAYAIATERYIRETGDDQIVEEPVLADTLYASSEDIAARRNEATPLYTTEVTPAGATATLPFTLHGNAVVAFALDVFRRTLDEETARDVEDPEAVRAALRRQFTREGTSKAIFASAIDLKGTAADEDDPLASALWLPMFDLLERTDSTYRRTVRAINGESVFLAQHVARLLGPDARDVMTWLRRAPLDQGLAAEQVDGEGNAIANGADAALGGLLASTLWHAVHTMGVTP